MQGVLCSFTWSAVPDNAHVDRHCQQMGIQHTSRHTLKHKPFEQESRLQKLDTTVCRNMKVLQQVALLHVTASKLCQRGL